MHVAYLTGIYVHQDEPWWCSAVFRWTWTDAEELLKEKSLFILSFVFLSEFGIRQVQTNIWTANCPLFSFHFCGVQSYESVLQKTFFVTSHMNARYLFANEHQMFLFRGELAKWWWFLKVWTALALFDGIIETISMVFSRNIFQAYTCFWK